MRVFDVCGTIYASNTTFDFIIEYHKTHGNMYKYFFAKTLLSFPFKILNRLHLFSIRNSLIQTLKGESRINLEHFGTKFVNEFLSGKQKEITINILNKELLNSILISASVDPVINAVSKKLNVKAYSSLLEYNCDGICTGKLSSDLKGIKSSKVDFNNLDLVVTDNMSDIDLIKKSKLAYLIIHKNNKGRWLHKLNKNSISKDKVRFL
ncbi:hypothetical protein ACTK7M_000503 [Escherichia albertii]|nr:hypothetical protein [Escherichia albertii]MCU7289882.1 hypothetical protein [Escherichia albertii]QTA15956.1 hypothetical protein FYK19_08735 [Escherichia albertii]HAX3034871.1 hypothetical protein [Escherichia albertii]